MAHPMWQRGLSYLESGGWSDDVGITTLHFIIPSMPLGIPGVRIACARR
jgi:hypothetical protein